MAKNAVENRPSVRGLPSARRRQVRNEGLLFGGGLHAMYIFIRREERLTRNDEKSIGDG